MPEFNEIKEKVLTTIGTAVDITKDAAFRTADMAKAIGVIAKLSVEINGERDVIKKAYTEIGKLYYEKHRDNPDNEMAQLCGEINMTARSIADKESEIERMKMLFNDRDCEEIEIEIDELVNAAGEAAESAAKAELEAEAAVEAAIGAAAEEVREVVVKAVEEAVIEVEADESNDNSV